MMKFSLLIIYGIYFLECKIDKKQLSRSNYFKHSEDTRTILSHDQNFSTFFLSCDDVVLP